METGVALLKSLKVDLLTADKDGLGTFPLVSQKRITAVYLSIGILRNHLPFHISSDFSTDLFPWNSKYYYEKLISENNLAT